MKRTMRNTAYDFLNKYCHHAPEGAIIEVTEWTNGEGFDVRLERGLKGEPEIFNLTYGEYEALMTLVETGIDEAPGDQ